MKKSFIYIISVVILSVFIKGCPQKKPLLPPLNETYKKSDTQPFGAFVAYHHFQKLFNYTFIETNRSFDKTWSNIKDEEEDSSYFLYILLAKNLVLTNAETKAMISYVEQGNDLFISADYIDEKLLKKLNCHTERQGEIMSEVAGKMNTTFVKMDFGSDYEAPSFKYYYYPFLNYFSGYDTASARVLGVNEIGKPNYMIFFIGKGRLYLHAAPRTFSNYFLLTANNYHYLENVISYLRFEPKYIYWDEYYKNKIYNRRKWGRGSGDGDNNTDKNNFSSFNVINKNPPLLWAFWLSVAALLLYILFNIKRKQRVINEIKPNINATVNFTETVGRLYLQKKNNKIISEKMITYFYENIRNNYFLNTNLINEGFIKSLSGKSGVPVDVTQQLFNAITDIQATEDVDDSQLLTLHDLMQKFYKNKS